MSLSEAISGSLERVSGLLTQAFAANEQLQATGVGVVDVRLLSLRPDEGVESSLRAPLLEQLRAEADRALYERRALAVERESQISAVEAESRRIVEKAKAFETDWNTAGRARTANDAAYIQAVAEAGPEVARALALKELAGHMPSFGNITITADVLSDLVSAFTGSAKAGK